MESRVCGGRSVQALLPLRAAVCKWWDSDRQGLCWQVYAGKQPFLICLFLYGGSRPEVMRRAGGAAARTLLLSLPFPQLPPTSPSTEGDAQSTQSVDTARESHQHRGKDKRSHTETDRDQPRQVLAYSPTRHSRDGSIAAQQRWKTGETAAAAMHPAALCLEQRGRGWIAGA